jgi:AAA15 family ATPase/GTPase
MKIKSFYVVNYRSIINSKECFLSPNDGITILAGQNESGKSSLLEALKHYESNIPLLDAYRDEENLDKPPHVFCTYTIEEKENLYNKLNTSSDIDKGSYSAPSHRLFKRITLWCRHLFR